MFPLTPDQHPEVKARKTVVVLLGGFNDCIIAMSTEDQKMTWTVYNFFVDTMDFICIFLLLS